MGVTVHTHTEQYGECRESGLPTSQYGLYLGKDGQYHDKPNGLGVGGDVESGEDAGKESGEDAGKESGEDTEIKSAAA
jgi:hypothetical protein